MKVFYFFRKFSRGRTVPFDFSHGICLPMESALLVSYSPYMVDDVAQTNIQPAIQNEVRYMARYADENHLCFGSQRRVSSVKQERITVIKLPGSNQRIICG